MSKSPLSNSYQKRLRQLVNDLLPHAKRGHIAEAIAAGYGYQTHNALADAIKTAETREASCERQPFDVDVAFDRLAKFGIHIPFHVEPLLRSALEHEAPVEVAITVFSSRLYGSRSAERRRERAALIGPSNNLTEMASC